MSGQHVTVTKTSGEPFSSVASAGSRTDNLDIYTSRSDLLKSKPSSNITDPSSYVNPAFTGSDDGLANEKPRQDATAANQTSREGLCVSRLNVSRDAVKGRGIPKMLPSSAALLPEGGNDGKQADDEDTRKEEKRETWGKKVDFLLSVIGFAVDLGNVWRFPYICYRNGGGAFLIPYLIMLVFLGIPLFYMELALGQYQKTGVIRVWKRICPMFTGVGYGICIVSTLVGAYYNTVIAWGAFYLFSSFRAEVPWKNCNNTWNTANCISLANNDTITNTSVSAAAEFFINEVLEFQRSTGVGDIGTVKWSLCLCLLLVFIIIYFCLWKGIKSSGKAVWVTATLPYIVLFILLIRGCTLPGASNGIYYFVRPDFSRLLKVEVWVDAAAQIFFSLGPGFGTLLALSSYNKFHNNCTFDAILTPIINCLTSLLAGFVVFSVLGYMAHLQHTDVEKVAAHSDGPGLVFVVYPEAIATLPGSTGWSIIFFLMLITLGLDSSFGGLESCITAITDQYTSLRNRREIVVGVQILLCFVIGLPTTTYGGQYVIQLLDTHAAPISLIFICFIEVVAVNWFYGVKRFSSDIETMLGSPPGIFWKVCWTFICPLSLLTLFILSIVGYQGIQIGTYRFPHWSEVVGWCVTSVSLLCIPVFMVYWFLTSRGSLKTRCWRMIKPSERPYHVNRTFAEIKALRYDGLDLHQRMETARL